MSKRPYDDSYLLSYSGEHIVYEIDMFFGIAVLFSPASKISANSLEDAKRLNYAMVESCGIHLRNLIDFFYLEKLQATDVVAADFCSTWQTIRPPISSSLEKARTRANKELAHLTTDRLAGTPPEKGWDFSSLAGEVGPILKLFVIHARKTALSSRVSAVAHHYAG